MTNKADYIGYHSFLHISAGNFGEGYSMTNDTMTT